MREIKKKQLDYMDWEMGTFFHFGIRTFYEGHVDWDMREMPLEGFQPTELDCEQWIRTIKEAGATYAVLVCKHHDGFANWPSAYTEYSVANTPWKDGKGDVVREFVDACRKYDVKVGLYYSPAQFGSIKMAGKEYDDYFINQLSELLTNYGKIDYLYFDGCGSENHEYDAPRIITEIRRLQPEILIYNMWDPDVRWVGNEAGVTLMPNHNIVSELDFSVQTDKKDVLEEMRFMPGECDCRMRLQNWFYSDSDVHTVKSVDELMGIYYYSIGRGANLLVNIGPDRRGLLPDEDATNFVAFGKKVKEMFANSLAGMEQIEKQDNMYVVTFEEPTLINHVVLEEVMDTAEHIEKFSVYIYPYPILDSRQRTMVYQGTTVGHKHICRFPSLRTTRVEIVIEEENAEHVMRDINLYCCETK